MTPYLQSHNRNNEQDMQGKCIIDNEKELHANSKTIRYA